MEANRPDEPVVVEPVDPAELTDAASAPAPVEKPPKPPSIGELRRERKRLWDERQETVYHVGGLAVDLRRRGIEDHELVDLRSDIVLEMDERLTAIDAQLHELDPRQRRLAAKVPPTAGYCMSCGAPFQEDAAFCFRCGARVAIPEAEAAPAGDDSPTTVIGLDGADR